MGPLAEPMDASTWKDSQLNCMGLFSHSDQQNAAATLKCQELGRNAKGTGGRIADALQGLGKNAESFSIAGTSTWSEGFNTLQQIIDSKAGSVRFTDPATMQPLVNTITAREHSNVYCEEFSKSLKSFVDSSETLGTKLDGVTLATSYTASSGLQKQLHQVSRLISARTARGAERDMFFVSIGGFDAHSNAAESLELKFTEINDAIQGFVAEMRDQNMWDSVVFVSHSEFGRSLTTNGYGTDHGWGGNYFVLGGKVIGGKILNTYPTDILEGHSMDAGRGRMIPHVPFENVMVPIAEWLGVDSSHHSTVFPNKHRFTVGTHILAENTLFNP
jgi:uncharacterized protein (DUF1501 family)